jgi:hypothetical protein
MRYVREKGATVSKTSTMFDVMRKRWVTAGDLQFLGLSQCPWARINESAHRHLKRGERIVKRKVRSDGLQEQRIVRVVAA